MVTVYWYLEMKSALLSVNTVVYFYYMLVSLLQAYGPKALVKTCLYTMPPDRNFVVDTLSGYGHSGIIVCIGAGHAFKWVRIT